MINKSYPMLSFRDGTTSMYSRRRTVAEQKEEIFNSAQLVGRPEKVEFDRRRFGNRDTFLVEKVVQIKHFLLGFDETVG